MKTNRSIQILITCVALVSAISLTISQNEAKAENSNVDRWEQLAVRPEFTIRSAGARSSIADYSDKAQLARANYFDDEPIQKTTAKNSSDSIIDTSPSTPQTIDNNVDSFSTEKITSLIDEVTSKVTPRNLHRN